MEKQMANRYKQKKTLPRVVELYEPKVHDLSDSPQLEILATRPLKKPRGENADTVWLSKLIQRKFVDLFGEDCADHLELATESLNLARHFSWNRAMAKRNLEVLARQVWMRIRSRANSFSAE
jgi:hypothetical protein